MSATALMVLSQGPNTASGGVALLGTLSDGAVNVANDNNTDVISWSIELVDVPPGSGLATGVLNAATSSTPNATFSPDVPGSYRLKLTVNGSSGETDIDIRVFAIPLPGKKFVLPPYQKLPDPLPVLGSSIPGAKPNETNFGGQARGWMGDADPSRRLLHQVVQEVNDILVLPPLSTANDGEVPVVTVFPYQEPIAISANVTTAFVLSSNFSTTGDPTIFPHLTGLDPDDNSTLSDLSFGLSNEQATCAVYDGSQYIWLGSQDSGGNGQVRRFDPSAGSVGAATAYNASQGATAIDFGNGFIWAGDGSALTQIDPVTPATQVIVGGLGAPVISDVLFDRDTTSYGDVRERVWVTDVSLPGLRRVEVITPAQDASLAIPGTASAKGITAGGGFVWMVSKDSTNFNNATLYRFIPDPAALSSFDDDIESVFSGNTGGDVFDVLYDPVTAHIYVFGVDNAGDPWIVKADPSTLLVVSSVQLTTGLVVSAGGPPPRMKLFKNAIWVPLMGTGGTAEVYRLDPAAMTAVQLDVHRAVAWDPAGGVTMAGDVTGPSGANTVTRIQNNDVLAGVPTLNGAVYAWLTGPNRFQNRLLGMPDFDTTIVAVTGTPYAHVVGQNVLAVDTTTIGGPSIINLATLGTLRQEVLIYDNQGAAAANPITVNAPGGHNINGGASAVISYNYGALRLFFDGSTNWRIV